MITVLFNGMILFVSILLGVVLLWDSVLFFQRWLYSIQQRRKRRLERGERL